MACGLSTEWPSFHRHTGDCAPFQSLGQVSPARLASSSALIWLGLTGWPFCINAKPVPFSETVQHWGSRHCFLDSFNGLNDHLKYDPQRTSSWVSLLTVSQMRSSRNPSPCWQSVEQLVHRLVWVYCKWLQLYVDRASILQQVANKWDFRTLELKRYFVELDIALSASLQKRSYVRFVIFYCFFYVWTLTSDE